MSGKSEAWPALGVCLFLAAMVATLFGPTLGHGFVNYDDDAYIHLQPEVVRGLSWDGVVWAFTQVHSGNRHPLTSLSHMLDCQLWGLNARGHHFGNVLLHGASALLLFLALRAMTGALWRSAFVATLFAIHPLRVESVAWVSERKDVLSGFFFMLTLLAYHRYAQRPGALRYGAVALLFALGLMAKPMLITLPFLLLLLDFWPLRRPTRWPRLLLEKLPLFFLCAVSALATMQAQTHTMRSLELLPLSARLANAAVALVTYIGQFFWPTRLGVFYPLPEQVSIWKTAFALALVVALTLLTLRLRRSRPYLTVGWLWYLGMLVPVLGLVQVGLQSHADRYTYLPQIGFALALTWGIADLSASWKFRPQILTAAAALIVGALSLATARQVDYWQSSETLWRRTLAVTEKNAVAHTNLGTLLPALEALAHYEAAVALEPDAPIVLNNLAWIRATAPDAVLRDGAQAVRLAERANQLLPAPDPIFLRALAAAYAEAGRFSEAIATAQRALPLAEAAGIDALVYDLSNNIAGYRHGEPVRDTSLGGFSDSAPPAADRAKD